MKSRKILSITKEIGSHKNFNWETLWTAIETQTGIKLRAKNETDVIDGYVNVYGNNIEVFLYDEAEQPDKDHKTTFRKIAPTAKQLTDLDTAINSFFP